MDDIKGRSKGADLPRGSAPGLHAQLLEHIGTEICSGQLQPGDVVTIDTLAEGRGVSRSVVREVLRVVASMGLVETRRKVGTIVRPVHEWNLFDPQVIRWRLKSPDRLAQLRSLIELRMAVEPHAASLAAEKATPREAAELVGIAAQLRAAGEVGAAEEFLRVDILFHQLVLRLSGNEMFRKLQDLVAEVLTGRHEHELTYPIPGEAAMREHAEVAQAIQWQDGERARRAMVHVMDIAWVESTQMWEKAVND